MTENRVSLPLKKWFHQIYSTCQPYFILYQSRTDIQFTLIALVYGLICLFCVCLANAYADKVYFTEIQPNQGSLIDPGMRYLNTKFVAWGFHYKITDVFVIASMLTILLLSVSYRKYACLLIRRVILIASTMYLMRAPTIVMTVLPNPNAQCEDKRNPNLFVDALLLFVQHHQACGDIFFSGHSILITISLRMYFMYCHHWIPKLVILIISSLGLLSLVMSALHYSIDVLYGFFLTSLVFSLYHWTIHHKLGTHSKWAAKLRYFDHPDSELSLPRRSRASPRTVEYRPMIQTSPYSLSHVISSSTTPSIRGSGQHQFTRASLLGNVKDDETDPSVIRRTYHTFHEGTGSFINLDGELINLQKAYEVSERVENEIGFENNWTEDDVEKEKKEGQGPSQV